MHRTYRSNRYGEGDANNTQIDELEIEEETAKKSVRPSLKNASKCTQSSNTNDKQIEELKNEKKSTTSKGIKT